MLRRLLLKSNILNLLNLLAILISIEVDETLL